MAYTHYDTPYPRVIEADSSLRPYFRNQAERHRQQDFPHCRANLQVTRTRNRGGKEPKIKGNVLYAFAAIHPPSPFFSSSVLLGIANTETEIPRFVSASVSLCASVCTLFLYTVCA